MSNLSITIELTDTQVSELVEEINFVKRTRSMGYGDVDRRRRERWLSFLFLGERDREVRRRMDEPVPTIVLSRLSARFPFERRNRSKSSASFSMPSSSPGSTGPSNCVAGGAAAFSLLRFHMSFFRHRGHSTTFTSALLGSPCSS